MNEQTASTLKSYDNSQITVGTICSHSALQIFYGARKEGLRTLGMVKSGKRKMMYETFPAAKPDEYIEVNEWNDVLDKELQGKLLDRNTIIVPHGSFVEYVGSSNMIDKLNVPVLGNKKTLEWESDRKKQRKWLLEAGIKVPKEYNSPDEIDGKVFVKLGGAKGGKGFFTAKSKDEYFSGIDKRIENKLITEEDAKTATVQEFLPGVRYYPHFFVSPFEDSIGLTIKNGVLAFMGFDKRIEPVDEAYRALPDVPPEVLDYSITGNQIVTIRESLLPDIIEMGKNVVEKSQELMPPGIIGPFALETFYHPATGFTVFEISARIVAGTNPFGEGSEYSIWTFDKPVSTGRRIATEIKKAIERGELYKIVS